MEDLRISLIQSELFWESAGQNLAMFTQKINRIETPTDLIILPEMFSTGFTMNAAANAESVDGPAMEWMRETASRKNCVVTGSLIIKEAGNYFNRLIWMKPDGTFLYYNKRHLFRLAHEEATYTAGNRQLIVELNGWKIYPLICYDLRFPVWSRRTQEVDYDLLIYVANWPERRVNAWKKLLPARAIENQCYVAGLNRVGKDGHDISHSGASALYDFKGDLLSSFTDHTESVETISIAMEALVNFRKNFPFWQDADEFGLITG